MMHLAKKLLGYGILLGIPLSPAFSSDAIYLLAWLLLGLIDFCQVFFLLLLHSHLLTWKWRPCFPVCSLCSRCKRQIANDDEVAGRPDCILLPWLP